MKIDQFQFAIQPAIKIVAFLIIASLIPFKHGIVYWMSVGFTILGFAVYVFGKHRAVYVKPNVKSEMFGCEMVEVFEKYIKAQILCCLVFIIIGNWIPIWLPMIVYCVILGAAVSGIESQIEPDTTEK